MKFGLKLYTTDVSLIPEVHKLLKDGIFDYIELYVVPTSYKKTVNDWKSLDCLFVLHAPHSLHGFNLAQKDKRETNRQIFSQVQLFADILEADYIIVHGGNNGSFDETLHQLSHLNERRIILENKPKIGPHNELCVGWSPHEFLKASESNLLHGIALDFGHAVCAACSLSMDVMEFIKGFLKFNPKIFHLSDGNSASEKDIHLNFGKGNLDIKAFISFLPDAGLLTLETPRSPSRGLRDFTDDLNFVKGLFRNEAL